jgi:transposase
LLEFWLRNQKLTNKRERGAVPIARLSNFLLLPDLKLEKVVHPVRHQGVYHCTKIKTPEVCPRCASLSVTGYDTRRVRIQDSPIRGSGIVLIITKRRMWCKTCKKPFTEPIEGILPCRRKTQRFRKSVAWAAENFSDLKRVRRAYNCSNDFIYKAFYEQLHYKSRMHNEYPFPSIIGIDEHHFKRNRGGSPFRPRQFVTMIVDYKNKKLFDLVEGKSGPDLRAGLSEKQGRENVKNAVIDMSDSYKSFIRDYFPNAQITADKFHVLRLITPAINRRRKEITGDKRSNPVRRLLLRNFHSLQYFERSALQKWLQNFPELHEVYSFKERIHAFYRIHGYHRAERAFTQLTDQMAKSTLPEIKTLRNTFMRWRKEILNYFKFKLTNARTEGYNNVAKVIKRRSYGFRNFQNYRLRLLNACC